MAADPGEVAAGHTAVPGEPVAQPVQPPLLALLESLLFVAPEPAAIPHLAQTLAVPVEAIEAALVALALAYGEAGRHGLRLQRNSDRVQLTTMPEAAPYVERYLGLDLGARLSAAATETLAVVAYQQPITRAQIEAVRGVSCDAVLRTLVSRAMVEPVGRLEQAGRPILYGTTFQFLQYFGLESLTELPALPDGETAVRIVEAM